MEETKIEIKKVVNVTERQALALLDIYGSTASSTLRELGRITPTAVAAANCVASQQPGQIRPALLAWEGGDLVRVSHSGCTKIRLMPVNGKWDVVFTLRYWAEGTADNPVGSSLYWDGLDRLIREALAEA